MGVRSDDAVSGVVGWRGAPRWHHLARGNRVMPLCGGTRSRTGNMCCQPPQLFLRHPTGIRKLNDVHHNHPDWHLVRAHTGEKRESNIPLCRSEEAANELGKEMAIRTTR